MTRVATPPLFSPVSRSPALEPADVAHRVVAWDVKRTRSRMGWLRRLRWWPRRLEPGEISGDGYSKRWVQPDTYGAVVYFCDSCGHCAGVLSAGLYPCPGCGTSGSVAVYEGTLRRRTRAA